MASNEAWGLDIGQTAIRAVKLRRAKDGSAQISDQYFQLLDTHLEDPDYDEKVVEALQEFASSKNVGVTPVVVSLPGFKTLFRDFAVAVEPSRMAEIVSYEAKQLIPFDLDDVIWDYHELGENDEGDTQIALVCCRRDIIEGLLGLLDEAQLNVEALQLGPLGLINYVQQEVQPEGPTLILDTGARGTDFIIVNESAFWLRSIGVSGADLTKALMGKFNIDYEKAEDLKLQVGSSKQGARVFKVMQPVLRNLCGEVQRTVGYYKSLFRGVNLDEVVCAGNTYLLPGIDQFVADNTGLPARTLELPETMAFGFAADEGELEENRQVMGTAIGLALQGIGLAEIGTNLLPPERRMAKFVKAKVKFGIGLVAAVAFWFLISFLTSGGTTSIGTDVSSRFQPLVDNIEKAEKAEKSQKKKYEELKKEFPRLTARNRAMASVAPNRGYLREIMGSVIAVVDRLNNPESRRGQVQAKIQEAFGQELANIVRQQKLEQPPAGVTEKDPKYGARVQQWSKLQGRIRRNLEWRFRRQEMIVLQTVDFRIVPGVEYKNKPRNGPEVVYWKPQLSKQGGGSSSSSRGGPEPTGKEQDLVQVTITGYAVTESLARTASLKNALERLPVLVEWEVQPQIPGRIQWRTVPNVQGSIRVPSITIPQIIGGESGGGETPAPGFAGAAPPPMPGARSRAEGGLAFSQATESRISLEIVFYCIPEVATMLARTEEE